MSKLLFIAFTGFLLLNQDNWKEVLVKLLNIISEAVSEYFYVFLELFGDSFKDVVKLINILVEDYFDTFQICYNHTLDVLTQMVDNYLDLLKFLIFNLKDVPNSWVYTFGAIVITYILKN